MSLVHCLATVLVSAALVAAEPAALLPIQAPIDAVTVHLDRAWITRRGQVMVPPGTTRVLLAGVASELDESSIRVSLGTGARLVSMRVERVPVEDAAVDLALLDAAVAAADATKRERLDERRLIDQRRQAAELAIESAFRSLATPVAGTALPDAAAITALLTTLDEERQQAAVKLRAAETAIAEAERHLSEARTRRMAAGPGRGDLEARILLDVASESGGSVDLTCSYLMPGALWIPAYGLRLESDRASGVLERAAIIQNATGEDWTGVLVTLAATRPSQALSPPQAEPWRLGVAASVKAANTFGSGGYGYDPAANLQLQGGQRIFRNAASHSRLLDNSVAVACVAEALQQRGASLVMQAEGRHDIRADGSPRRIALGNETVQLALSRQVVPRLDTDVHLLGSLVNPLAIALLPGSSSLFVAGDLVGRVDLPFLASGEAGVVPLGVDERIKVTRSLDRRHSSKSYSGARSRLEIAWTISVSSFHDKAVGLRLVEAIPQSDDEQVRVRVREVSPRPASDLGGLNTWDLSLNPEQAATVRVAYAIEYPTGARVRTTSFGAGVAAPAPAAADASLIELEGLLQAQ